MARGSGSGFVALMFVFATLFVVIALLRVITVALLDEPEVERGDSAWRQVFIAFLELTDPGSMTQDIGSEPVVKIFAVIAGLAGFILLSALIAFITNALDQRMQQLRKGHSQVIMEDHALILGWNERIVDIARELILAFESEPTSGIVILAEQDKEMMDDYLSLNLPDTLRTKVVTRSGRPNALVNLRIAAIDSAKSIIVLAGAEPTATKNERDRSDIDVIKTLLAATSVLDEQCEAPVVAEVYADDRRQLAQAIHPNVTSIDSSEMLAKILVQTSRSEGLAVVYEEMLSFDGSEIYFYQHPALVGRVFGHLSFSMLDGVAMGIVDAEGQIDLNPESTTVLGPADQLIVLATDDSTIDVATAPLFGYHAFNPSGLRTEGRIERELLIGWTPKVETIVSEYSDYVHEGSSVDILLRAPSEQARATAQQLQVRSDNLEVRLLEADPFDRDELLALRPFDYDNIIILSEAGGTDTAEWVDSETLLLLLQLQQLFREQPQPPSTKLIAEVLDSRNRELIAQTGTKEFIISNRLISMITAQLSENGAMRDVYDNLFSEDGSEVYLKPISLYFEQIPPESTFADLIAAAMWRGEIALGIRSHSLGDDPNRNFGVRLIPPKDEVMALHPRDSLVVLAEDES